MKISIEQQNKTFFFHSRHKKVVGVTSLHVPEGYYSASFFRNHWESNKNFIFH